jgi:hypothetical protein
VKKGGLKKSPVIPIRVFPLLTFYDDDGDGDA